MKGISVFQRSISGFVASMFVLLLALAPLSVNAKTGSEQAKVQHEQSTATVNINKAGIDALSKTLTGVGKSKAGAIITYREQYGDFKSVDQLLEVKGIGKSTLERNRKRIEL